MGFHLHLGARAAEGDVGGVGSVFIDEEVKDINRLSVFGRNCRRWGWSFWRRFNNCDGILIVAIEGVFNVGFARDEGGGCRADLDSLLGLLGRLLLVEGTLILLRF